MDCKYRKEALKKMKLQDGGAISEEQYQDLLNFNNEGQRRVEMDKFNRPSRVVPDMGDSETSRLQELSPEERIRQLRAFVGDDQDRSPASEMEQRPSMRSEKTIPEGTDEEMARKILSIISMRDSFKR